MRYWVFFYTFRTPTSDGDGSMHLSTEGKKHISINQTKEEIAKALEDQYSVRDVKVSILSFNELKEKDYEASK